MIAHLGTRKKRHSFYIARLAIRRVVWLRCINSSWNFVFTRPSVLFAFQDQLYFGLGQFWSTLRPFKSEKKATLSSYNLIFHMYWCDILTSHSETRSDLAPYLFTNAFFVFNPFNESLLNLSAKRSFSHLYAWGSLPWRKAPGISSWVGTRAAIRDNQNNSAQLGPVRPNGPPYLHSVYYKYRNYSTWVCDGNPHFSLWCGQL